MLALRDSTFRCFGTLRPATSLPSLAGITALAILGTAWPADAGDSKWAGPGWYEVYLTGYMIAGPFGNRKACRIASHRDNIKDTERLFDCQWFDKDPGYEPVPK